MSTKVVGRGGIALSFGGNLLGRTFPLPSFTLRFEFSDVSYSPLNSTWSKGSWTKVQGASTNQWDWTYENTNWLNAFENKFTNQNNLVKVVESNTTGVLKTFGLFDGCSALTEVCYMDVSATTDTRYMFRHCTSLRTSGVSYTRHAIDISYMYDGCTSLEVAPYLNTSEVIDAFAVFRNCTSIRSVPLLNLPVVVNVDGLFYNCINVETGALDLFNHLFPRGDDMVHVTTFYNCGSNTETGRTELSQIRADWKRRE